MQLTKVVCTLGPSSDTLETVEKMVRAGMDVVRLNLSHGTHGDHRRMYRVARDAAARADSSLAIMMDLQGPKIRTGRLRDGKAVALEPGARITITTEAALGDETRVSTTYEQLAHDVKEGDRILLADGAMEFRVEAVAPPEVRCRVVTGGMLGEHKGINLPGVAVSAPSFTEKDAEDLALGIELGVDYVALSFVRSAADVRDVKNWMWQRHGASIPIVAKIERPEALECFDEILNVADGIMVARGDLGVEVPLDDVPQIQKDIIRKCNRHGITVITATQMLESMMTSPRPTRAEVNDVANAIYDGTDAVMLSGETASGKYPVQAVEIMAQVAEKADAAIAKAPKDFDFHDTAVANASGHLLFADAIGHAVAHICDQIRVRRIVCLTMSGFTAAMIARYRPAVPITAITLNDTGRRRCALYWGVDAVESVGCIQTADMERVMDEVLLRRGLAEKGDTVVLVAGMPLHVKARTNLLKIHTVGEHSIAQG